MQLKVRLFFPCDIFGNEIIVEDRMARSGFLRSGTGE